MTTRAWLGYTLLAALLCWLLLFLVRVAGASSQEGLCQDQSIGGVGADGCQEVPMLEAIMGNGRGD